jgi:hypothetical protein
VRIETQNQISIPSQRNVLDAPETMPRLSLVRQPVELPVTTEVAPILPVYDTEVNDWQTQTVSDSKHGTVFTDTFIMSDGMGYQTKFGEPRTRKTDVPVAFTTAWCTGTEGHNMHTMLKLMDEGYPVMMIGPEGLVKDGLQPAARWKQARATRLGYTAHNIHEILNEVTKPQQYDRDSIVVIGESRGGMTAMCLNALADQYKRHIVKTIAVAPCYARPFRRSDGLKLTEQIIMEPAHLVQAMGHVSLSAGLHDIGTFPVKAGLRYFTHMAALAPVLFSGETGRYAKLIPKDRDIDIETFNGDYSSQPDEWEKIFEAHPNVKINRRPGGHLSIPNALPGTITTLRKLLPSL